MPTPVDTLDVKLMSNNVLDIHEFPVINTLSALSFVLSVSLEFYVFPCISMLSLFLFLVENPEYMGRWMDNQQGTREVSALKEHEGFRK